MILKKKIGILINSERELDYYKNLLKKFPKNYFKMILNDLENQINYKRSRNFLKKKRKNFFLASNYLGKNEKIDVILSTGLGPIKKYSIISLIYFFYARSFGIAIKLLGLDKVFYFFLKRSFTGGAEKSKPFQVHQIEKKISKISICYPRGLDIDINRYPQIRWIKTFDYFFCHCKKDFQILRNKLDKKKLRIIGYPRYDLNFSLSRAQKIKKKIFKEFLINKYNKILLWIPTIINKKGLNEIENISMWVDLVNKFATENNYTIILRPHPNIDNQNIKVLTQLKKKYKIKLDLKKKRNLNELYLGVDLVISDYGGSIFSALYHLKQIILLNLPENHFYVVENRNNLTNIIRKHFININLNNKFSTVKKLPDKNDIKKLKKNIFGKNLDGIKEIKKFLKTI